MCKYHIYKSSYNSSFFLPAVEEDEDEFPAPTRHDGEYNHNNNGSKEKCESNLVT